ncbi:hypothetical protein [Erwinia psidii]|uniref:hypothetical protein n=1 Tax=Erwinia psidii TaxID=69224 RepID=UPI000F532C93|nr:hypothetical protein [Erwinia psidii]MCX8958893.1 hypothetical protein [Erwinia psidii]MCX8961965.1 hypothetical protein [Erwinia psidii]MCX8966230.1 hypothetical protein [Erwinia psidii]
MLTRFVTRCHHPVRRLPVAILRNIDPRINLLFAAIKTPCQELPACVNDHKGEYQQVVKSAGTVNIARQPGDVSGSVMAPEK